jgi:hypothetical protein
MRYKDAVDLVGATVGVELDGTLLNGTITDVKQLQSGAAMARVACDDTTTWVDMDVVTHG